MKLRIARTPYLSSALFYYGLETNPETLANLDFVSMVPSELARAVMSEEVDAGPVPLVTTFELADSYEQLGDYCIATAARTRSVLLFSNKPIEELDHAIIGTTNEAVTAIRLLDVLFAQLYRITPDRYVSLDEPNDGFLLVGNAGLLNRKGCVGFPYITDLGEVWHDRTGLPFVHTVWMVRKALPREHKEYLKGVLASSLNEGWKHLTAAVRAQKKKLGMTRIEIREYLDGFNYHMGPAEHDAIAKFTELENMTRKLKAEQTTQPAGPDERAV